MSILVNSLLRRPELRKVYSLLLRGREYFASSPEPSNPRPPPTRARAGIKEVHYLPFNPVDKRTALTYIESDANWHRVSKGAPDLANARPALRQKVLARSLSRTTFGTRGFSSEIEMPSQQTPMSFADIAERVVPAVVDVYVDVAAPDGNRRNDFFGSGSGFFLNEDTILTCSHVVFNKDWIHYPEYINSTKEVYIVLHNYFELRGIVVQHDVEQDVALIKVNPNCLDKSWYSWPNLGRSNQVRQGDIVCALGSPSCYKSTLITGVISHTCRTGYDIGLKNGLRTFFQTDIPITSGNSGGPVLNMNGEVIAVVTLGKSGFKHQNKIIERVEFVNPIDNVRKVLGI